MTNGEKDHDIVIEIRSDVKHLSRKVDTVLDRLEKGDERLRDHDVAITEVRACARSSAKKMDDHANAHWRTYALAIGLSSLAVAIAVAIASWIGG